MKKSRKKNLKKHPQNIPETKSSKNKMPIIIGIVIAAVIGSLAIFLISDSVDSDSQIMGTERAQAIIDNCTDDVQCAVKQLQSISKIHDRDTIIPLFVELISLYDVQVPCHQTGHHLGMWW